MKIILQFIIFILFTAAVFAQSDSVDITLEENAAKIDSLDFTVQKIIITGNETTKDEIILREMSLAPGGKFTMKKYNDDLLNIYNTALFTKVDILPYPAGGKDLLLNIDVQERWYIIPLPNGGIEDGEWKKIWAGMDIRWDNFRGRNERIGLSFRLFYNPSVSFSYFVPWVGKKLHLFGAIGGSWSRKRNQSLAALGRESGTGTLTFEDENFDNINYTADLVIGKTFRRDYSIFTNIRYNYMKVTKPAPGRTLSPDGIDKYMAVGLGFIYDSRDLIEYATKGDYLKTTYTRYGLLDKEINFGRYIFENQSFIPISIKGNYYLTFASKLYSSFAMGPIIPYYNHEYLGYSEDYVRGWKGKAYEGENVFTIYNELRIPIIKPRYIKAKDIMVVKEIPIIKNLDLRHGLYFTLLYDIGTVWYRKENIFKKRFISGVGMGINIIAPFGYVFRVDWVARIDKPVVGRIGLSLYAKF